MNLKEIRGQRDTAGISLKLVQKANTFISETRNLIITEKLKNAIKINLF